MAKEISETYLERLDYNKLFFTREDIDQIRNEYRSGIGDDILLGIAEPLGIAELESLKARIAQLELTVNRNGKPNIWRRPPMPQRIAAAYQNFITLPVGDLARESRPVTKRIRS
jgi:hypothetical protein